jgi:hypothetical protein
MFFVFLTFDNYTPFWGKLNLVNKTLQKNDVFCFLVFGFFFKEKHLRAGRMAQAVVPLPSKCEAQYHLKIKHFILISLKAHRSCKNREDSPSP